MTQYAQFANYASAPAEFNPGHGLPIVALGFSTAYNDADVATVQQAAAVGGVTLQWTTTAILPPIPTNGQPPPADTLTYLYNQVLAALGGSFSGTDPNALHTANDLSEIFAAGSSAQASARSNLGLGAAATMAVGTTGGTVAAGNDSRFGASSNSVRYDIAQGLNPTQIRQAQTNIAALPGVTPEQLGCTVDGTPGGNAALINAWAVAANAAGGGVLRGTPGTKVWCEATLQLKEGVWIDGGGGSKQSHSSQSFTLKFDHTGVTTTCIDTPSTTIWGAGLRCLRVTTDMSTPSATAFAGVRFQHVQYGILEHCVIDNVTDHAVWIAGGTGCIISDVGASYVVAGRTLIQPTGVLHINGTDHLVEKCEFFADAAAITYSGFWQCAAYVNCLTSWFIANEAEFGECGWYIDGPSGLGPSGAFICKWIGSRATYNVGHGFYIAGAASYNSFDSCYVFNCSQAGDGLYDGMFLANGSVANHVGNFIGASDTSPAQGGGGPGGRFYQMRYLYNDQNAIYSGDFANYAIDVWGQIDNFCVDTVNLAVALYPTKIERGAGAATGRGRSRHHGGRCFWDSTFGKAYVSSGIAWFAFDGKLTGINQLPVAYSECKQAGGATGSTSTTAWATGKGTLTVEQKIQQSTRVQGLPTPQVLKVVASSAAVTAGECDFSTTGLTVTVDPTQTFSVGGTFVEDVVSAAGNATVTWTISWYTSGVVFISSTTGLGSTAVGTTATKVTATVASASIPSNAAFAIIAPVITKSGMVAGTDTFFATQFWAMEGTEATFVPA